MKDFIKCYESQKIAYMSILQYDYANIDNILVEALKSLGDLQKSTAIFEAANEIAKKLITEYVHLAFMGDKPRNP